MSFEYKILTDDVAEKDFTSDQTHEKIAQQLFDLIMAEEDQGYPIGIEGRWGSGKSTVINLLKKKISNADTKKTNLFFYIDTWEHEGDPLRKVFIEAFIKQITDSITLSNDDKTKMEDIRLRATNKRITKTITHAQYPTPLGAVIGITTLAIPVGIALISSVAKDVTININYSVNTKFIIGLVLVFLSPIIALITTLLRIIKRLIEKKEIDIKKILSLWRTDKTEDITNETTQEEERTSVEFEQYFNEIIELITPKINKIILVVDNLDRINVTDALKIWATLQIFMQCKNPAKGCDKCKKQLWILVPYDPSGLTKLWDKESGNLEQSSEHTESVSSCSRYFFDKFFQLRIDVPEQVISGWETYSSDIAKQVLTGWTDDDRKIVTDILIWSRKDLTDTPSFRQIKTYINQIAFMRSMFDTTITTETIALFSEAKYIQGKSTEDIKKEIIDGKFPAKNLIFIQNEEIDNELCAIIFNVHKDIGMQLLLQKPIITALENKKTEELQKLEQTHKKAFWSILEHILQEEEIKEGNHVFSFYTSFWKKYPDKQDLILQYITAKKTEISANLNTLPINNIITIFEIAAKEKTLAESFFKSYGNMLNQSITQSPANISRELHNLKEICNQIPECSIVLNYNALKLSDFQKLIQVNKDIKFDIEHHIDISNDEKFDLDVSSVIIQGQPIPPELPETVKTASLAGYRNWNNTVNKIVQTFLWNKGTPSGENLSVRNIQIIENLLYNNSVNTFKLQLSGLLENNGFWNYIGSINNSNIYCMAAFLLGKYFENLAIPAFNPTENTQRVGYTSSQNIWKNESESSARYIWNIISYTNDFSFIWEIAKNHTNKLVKSFITIAINERNENFFQTQNPLQDFSNALAFFGETENKGIFESFCTNGKLIEFITNKIGDINLLVYPKATLLVLQNKANKTIEDKCKKELADIKIEGWNAAFTSNSLLLNILSYFAEQDVIVDLGNDYENALFKYMETCISKKSCNIIEKIYSLFAVMNQSFKEDFGEKTGRLTIDCKFDIPEIMWSFVRSVINKDQFFGKQEINSLIQNAIENTIMNSIYCVSFLLAEDKKGLFVPETRFATVLHKPVEELLKTLVDEKKKSSLIFLAEKLNIDLADIQQKDSRP
jgi:hypothetical protein